MSGWERMRPSKLDPEGLRHEKMAGCTLGISSKGRGRSTFPFLCYCIGYENTFGATQKTLGQSWNCQDPNFSGSPRKSEWIKNIWKNRWYSYLKFSEELDQFSGFHAVINWSVFTCLKFFPRFQFPKEKRMNKEADRNTHAQTWDLSRRWTWWEWTSRACFTMGHVYIKD